MKRQFIKLRDWNELLKKVKRTKYKNLSIIFSIKFDIPSYLQIKLILLSHPVLFKKITTFPLFSILDSLVKLIKAFK